MSLQIEAPTGLGDTAESAIGSRYELLDEVQLALMKEGFMPSNRPKYAPPVIDPAWLISLTPDRYHLMTAQLSAWHTYASEQEAFARCGVEECKEELKTLAAEIRNNIRRTAIASGEKIPSIAIIADEVTTNPRVQEVSLRQLNRTERLTLITPKKEAYGRDLRILSRALELRRQELGFGAPTD